MRVRDRDEGEIRKEAQINGVACLIQCAALYNLWEAVIGQGDWVYSNPAVVQ